MGEKYGVERIGFFTLTLPEVTLAHAVLSRKLHSLRTHLLPQLFLEWVGVRERHKSGGLHLHFVVALPVDIASGMDIEEVKAGRYGSANPELRKLWKTLRQRLPKFGFGRHELFPCLGGLEAVGGYLGKYVAKHIGRRDERDKHARLIMASAGARKVSTRFTWVEGKARTLRLGRAEWAKHCGFKSDSEAADHALRQRLGRGWARAMSLGVWLPLGREIEARRAREASEGGPCEVGQAERVTSASV